jgi:hypothetical protein
MDTLATDIAHRLRVAADWLDAHPDLTPVSVSASDYSATIHFRDVAEVERAKLMALVDPDRRFDYTYDEGAWLRICGGQVYYNADVTLSVAVSR